MNAKRGYIGDAKSREKERLSEWRKLKRGEHLQMTEKKAGKRDRDRSQCKKEEEFDHKSVQFRKES